MAHLEIFGSLAVGIGLRMAFLLTTIAVLLSAYGLAARHQSEFKIMGRGLIGFALMGLYFVLFKQPLAA